MASFTPEQLRHFSNGGQAPDNNNLMQQFLSWLNMTGQNPENNAGNKPGSNDVFTPMTGAEKINAGLNIANTGLMGYMAINQHNLAKKQFNFQKQAFNTNMANQAKANNYQLNTNFNKAFIKPMDGDRDAYMAKWGY